MQSDQANKHADLSFSSRTLSKTGFLLMPFIPFPTSQVVSPLLLLALLPPGNLSLPLNNKNHYAYKNKVPPSTGPVIKFLHLGITNV